MTGDPWSFGTASNCIDYGQYGHCTCPTVWHGIYPPPPCDYCRRNASSGWSSGWVTLTPSAPQPLSDKDVERIAKRVAELLKGTG